MRRRCQYTASGTYTHGKVDNLLNTNISKSGSNDIRRETED